MPQLSRGGALPRLWHRGCAAVAVLCGRPDRAEALWSAWLAQAPGDLHALASRSVLRARRGDLAAALEDAQRGVALHPQAGGLHWFNLGWLLERLGRADEAVAAFRQALDRDPGLDRAWYGMALAHLAGGRLEAADQALRACVRLQPMGPHGWYQLARLCAERGDLTQARSLAAHLEGFEPALADRLKRELAQGAAGGEGACPT